MDTPEKCRQSRLAGQGSFRVDRCGCGAVHLTIGFVTLRMDPLAYRELALTVEEALGALELLDGVTLH